MKIGKSDIIILFGLSLVGVGLFLWFGIGVSLTVLGTILLLLGVFEVVFPAKPKDE